MLFADAFSRFSDILASSQALLDLHAQMEMARWAYWMFWASAAGVLLSAGAVIAAGLSLRASLAAARDSRAAAREAREVGEFQTQAYVHAPSANFGMNDNVIVKCKNGGLTPATHFSVNGTAKLVNKGNVSESISFTNDGFKIWSSLGTGEELGVSILEGNEVIHQFRSMQTADQILLISGQILYCTIFNHDHVTQFAFYVHGSELRFRRPTANLVTYHRVSKAAQPQEKTIFFDDNEGHI